MNRTLRSFLTAAYNRYVATSEIFYVILYILNYFKSSLKKKPNNYNSRIIGEILIPQIWD